MDQPSFYRHLFTGTQLSHSQESHFCNYLLSLAFIYLFFLFTVVSPIFKKEREGGREERGEEDRRRKRKEGRKEGKGRKGRREKRKEGFPPAIVPCFLIFIMANFFLTAKSFS